MLGKIDDDPTSLRAAAFAIATTVEHGGGTFERGTLLPFTPASGFAVAEGGIAIPASAVDQTTFRGLANAVAGEFDRKFVGTWLNGGTMHIDAVVYFSADRREAAIAAGRNWGQEAIYDFAAQDSIYLDEVNA